jgi:hypothetical protein
MRSLCHAVVLGFLAGCAGQSSIKPAEVLDERTGITVGALQEPIELVQNSRYAPPTEARRTSFAYLGPAEWDRMGDISYGLWIHVAPGNDRQVSDIHAPGAVTLNLDDGPLVLTPIETPSAAGRGPYQPVVSWGQTAYFQLDVALIKRMAASARLDLDFRGVDDAKVNFLPGHETRATLTEFARARGIIGD